MRVNIPRPILPFLGIIFLLGGCATPAAKPVIPTAETHLVNLMSQRLEIARQVAWIKFQDHSPVRDKKRETALLTSLTAEGAKLGLSPKETSAFFQAQIAASCQVQQELIYRWRRGATLPAVAPQDLRLQIRPQLDRISEEMLHDLAAIKIPSPALRSYAGTVLKQAGFSWFVVRTATTPLSPEFFKR